MSSYSGDRRDNATQSAYLTICDDAVTLTADLLTSNIISSSLCQTELKHKRFIRYCVDKLSVCYHGCTYGQVGQPKNRMPLALF